MEGKFGRTLLVCVGHYQSPCFSNGKLFILHHKYVSYYHKTHTIMRHVTTITSPEHDWEKLPSSGSILKHIFPVKYFFGDKTVTRGNM